VEGNADDHGISIGLVDQTTDGFAVGAACLAGEDGQRPDE